ncbi:SUMF1/EgtB/PvdO family nonheme iron enzyme, partial [Rubripirellula sp.]
EIDDARFTSFQQWAVTTESKIRSDLKRLLQESEDLFKESLQHRTAFDYKSAIACMQQIHSRHLTPEWQLHLERLEVDQKTARKILRHVRRLLKQQSFDDVDDLLASASEYLGEHKAVVELRSQSQAYKESQQEVRKTALAAASKEFSNQNYEDVASCFDKLAPAFRTKAVDTWCDRASEVLEKLKALETRIYDFDSTESLDAKVRLADEYLQLSGSNEAMLQVRKDMLDGRDLHCKSIAAREAGDYDSAIAYMQQIHETSVSVAMRDFLKTLIADRDESQQLLSEIKEAIKARSFDGLLPTVLRAVELRGDREDLPKLKSQLVARQQKLEKQRDVCYAKAANLFECGNAKGALSKIDSVKTKDLRESDKHLKAKLTDVVKAEQSLTRLVADCNADGVSDPSAIGEMLPVVIAYLEMNPNHAVIQRLRQDLFGLIKKDPKSYAGFLTPCVLAKCPGSLLAVFPGPLLAKVPPITNSIGMELKLIPSGTFTMGENKDAHEVTLTKPFMLGVHVVTQEQYEQLMGVNPSYHKGSNNPVENVSWEDAVEFCRKLSELPAEKAAGRVYRLPTEAEWEYACRAGTTTKYSFGDDSSELGDYAWVSGNSGNTTHPVGGKQPNAWGLYDMHGNIWEWCQDWYGDYHGSALPDPTGPASGSSRVFRGGSWGSTAELCQSAYRDWSLPSYRDDYLGFRVSLSPSGQ